MRTISTFSNKQKIVSAVIFLLLAGTICSYLYYRAFQFNEAHRTYNEYASEHVNAAFIPGIVENPLRQQLNVVLAEVLAAELTDDERKAKAFEGLAFLKETEKQIDAIGDFGEATTEALNRMEGVAYGSKRNELVGMGRERLRIIADIRGLSYRANYHTAEIFNRIIVDGGVLTAAHVQDLNNQIPIVEEQFDRRSALYAELQGVTQRISSIQSGLSL